MSTAMITEISDLKVLAVEDNPQAMQLLRTMLADMGIRQVFTAKTGKEALDFLGDCETMIDVILCDWNLPQVSGFELLRQVRTVNPDIPFLMVTGAADRDSVTKAKENGVTGYIVKPYSKEALEKKIRLLLRVLKARSEADAQVWHNATGPVPSAP